jgi:hypothetical protein
MTDELKHKFQQLVADPPPPTGVPSDAVFTRIRTVRRRRTAAVAVLATAATVAVVAAAAVSATGLSSAPPVAGTPGAPHTVVTGPPTTLPTGAPPATTPTSTATHSTSKPPATVPADSATTVPADPATTIPTDRPTTPPPSTTTNNPPAAKPVNGDVTVDPQITGRNLTLRITFKGTILVPRGVPDNAYIVGNYRDNWLGDNYTYGDNHTGSGSDAGGVTCNNSTKRVTGSYTQTLQNINTYEKPGTYTIHFETAYCGPNGAVRLTRTATVTVK